RVYRLVCLPLMVKNLILGTAFVLLWSSGFVGAAWAPADVPWPTLLAWRYGVTAVLLLIMVLPRRPRLRLGDLARQALLGVLAHVVFLAGVFAATAGGTPAGTIALVCALQPLLVTLLGAIFWRDRLGVRAVTGLLLGIIGVAVTSGTTTDGWTAAWLPASSLVGLSAAALLERRWRHRAPDLLSALAVQVTVAAVVFGVAALITDQLAAPINGPFIGALAWLVLLSGLGGYAAFTACLRRLGATRTSTWLYLTPALTLLWAWLMLGQAPSAGEILGMAIAAGAVLLALTDGPRRAPTASSLPSRTPP
ncbi:MAG: DMT family transporter, partial [Propionibacteriales bacterium]|nr:DMT family transporter [Propionibacteriales bacterium]